MLYGQSSTEGRAMSGRAAFGDPAEDRDWAQAFLNDFEAAEDEDGQRQVLADYGHELTDPVHQDALRENLVGRLHRTAELEKMDPGEYMDRLSVLDSAPFGSKAGGQGRHGESRVASAALLLGLMGSAGIAGAPLRMPVPGRVPGPLGRMAPPPVFGPYPGFPADRQTKPDPYVTPMPDHREPPVLPGGGIGAKPVDGDNRTVLPDQSGEWGPNYFQSVDFRTRSGIDVSVWCSISDRSTQQLKNFMGEIADDRLVREVAGLIRNATVDTKSVKPDSLVNVTKSGGENTSLEDFDKLRSAAGVAESAVTHPDPGMLKFTTPDGTEVMWRSKSTRQGKTVEIHIHNPASRTVENGPGRAAGDKLPTMKLRYGE